MKRSAWSNKSVIITGARGFVGLHLLRYFLREGANVIGISRSGNTEKTVQADCASKRQLEPLFAAHSPVYACFHLAGDALVEQGQAGPYETFRNNIMSALNVLDLSRTYEVKRIVMASTVHVYGDTPAPSEEEDPPRPSRPYETSKTCTDLLAQSYADSYRLPVLIPRFANIYGPGDTNFTRLVPKTIRSVLRNQAPAMWGGSVMRDYLFIDDAIAGYVKLAELPDSAIEKNRIFNFGTGRHVTVREVIQTIIRLSGNTLSLKTVDEGREQEVLSQFVTWEKAKRILNWYPNISLEEGLLRTIGWYKNYFSSGGKRS